MSLKFGKKPAVFNRHTQRSALALAHHLDPLGKPPDVSNDYITAVTKTQGSNWGMMGNDQFGCCVEADDGHYLMLRTANASTIVIPSTQDILGLYSAETGFDPKQTAPDGSNPTDQGTDEYSDCNYMRTTGLLGHKADATASIEPTHYDHLKWGIQLFGAVKIGFIVSNSAMQQFNANQPWDWTGDNSEEGGHDVPLVGYDTNYFYAVTWGRVQRVTTRFLQHYCDEAHALLFFDWIRAQGTAPSGFDLFQLAAKLGAM